MIRILHTADWHLGRIFYGQYLTDDQAHVLENQFFSILKDEKIVDIRKIYKSGVTDSVIDSYRSYLKQ